MKKLLFIILILPSAFSAAAQVTLQPSMPAVGLIQKNQLWNLLAINNSTVAYNAKLDLVLTDRSSGLEVMSASTAVFELKAGAKQLNPAMLNPIQYNYRSTTVDSRIQGLLPPGNYTVCYSLVGTGVKEIVLAEECVSFDAEPLSPPMLAFPADSSVLSESPSQFTWIPPTPSGMFSNLRYEVILSEIKDGQKANEAIQENLPFYSDAYQSMTSMGYPASATKFEKNKWYAWQVVARDDRNYAGKSEVWVFKVGESKIEKIIKGIPFVQMKMDAFEMAVAPNGYLKIAYNNRYNDNEAKIEITDLSAGKAAKTVSFTMEIKPGENLLQYPLKKIMTYTEDNTYQASITNSKGERWSVLFRVKNFKD